jgi:hypothetical protein
MAILQIGAAAANPSVLMMGGSSYISVEFRTQAGVLTDPGTSFSIQIINVDGSIKTAYTTLTKDVVGRYYYVLTSTTAYSPGVYNVWIKCVDGGNTSGPVLFPNLFEITGGVV